jgi:hypothetical protein
LEQSLETGQTNVNGQSAYLFLGGNGTLGNSTINLEGLPTVPTTSIVIQRKPGNHPGPFQELAPPLVSLASLVPLATVLVCDPQMNVTGGIVSLDNGNILTPIKSGLAPVGNIFPSAARIIFSESLVQAVGWIEGSQIDANYINHVAALIFMADPTLDVVSSPTGIRPLDLSTINRNMDEFVGSAAKAYADGYYPRIGDKGIRLPTGDFTNMTVNATHQEMRIMIAPNEPLWIVTIVLVAMVMTLTTALLLRMGVYEPFTFDNVLKVAWGVELR